MDNSQADLDKTFHIEWERPRTYPQGYQEHLARWAEVARKKIVTDFPINLTLENSTACNLKCKMCMRNQLNLRHDFFPFRQWVKIMEEAKGYPDWHSIKPNYRNEPTINSELENELYIAALHGAQEVIINTNGNFPTSLLNRIVPYTTELAFSIDAFSEKTYQEVRPGGGYQKVMQNVFEALRLRFKYPKLRVRVAFVVQDQNKHEVQGFLSFWKQKEVDKVVINHCYNPGQKGQDRAIIRWKQREGFVCPQIYQRLVVTAQGVVLPCCGAYSEELKLGNIFKEGKPLRDYWLSDELSMIRELHERGQFKDILCCSTCALSYEPEVVKYGPENQG